MCKIIYYTCGHSSDGNPINLDEQNQAEVLEMIEKSVVVAFGGACPNCAEKEKSAQTIRVLQQVGLLPD